MAMHHNFDVPILGPESFSEISRLTREFTSPEASERWGIYEGRDDGGPLSVVATWIERTVFREMYGVDEADVIDEFSPYMDRSIWSVIVHHPTQMAIGAGRYLVGPSRDLLAARQFAEGWDMSWSEGCNAIGASPDDSFIEAASLAVLPEWRTADRMWPMKALCSHYMHLFEDLGAAWAVQIVNPRVMRIIQSWGTPFVPMAEAGEIHHVPFIPAVIPSVPGRTFFKTTDTEHYELMQNRNQTGRGGTRLPPIDLDRLPLVVQLDNEVRARADEAAQP